MLSSAIDPSAHRGPGRRVAPPPDPAAPRLRLALHGPLDPGRAAVEAFVAREFARRYGARIPGWAPVLASLDDAGRPIAAAGWRRADAPLYLERYLREPVEFRIAERLGIDPPRRSRIAEVGHLAADRPGAGRALMTRLAVHLASCGCGWIVSTVTPGVRRVFEGMGVQLVELGPARAGAVGSDGAAWGRYYDDGPVVVAGELLPNLVRVAPGRAT